MSISRTNLGVVIAVALMLFSAVLVTTRQAEGRSTAVPPGYQPLAEVALKDGAFAVDMQQVAAGSALNATAAVAFFAAALPQQLADYQIPGAAVAVVKGGEILFAQGYGYADLASERAASADQTLFRTGSAAKLFTWTAVMQLVEQGKLDLHTDINTYLTGFRIPDTYPEPITLAHLLTHTAGFEEASRGAMRARPEDLEPLGDYLARHIPARVYPPGQVTAYSNYGTALAGYIVEQVSGQPYAEYVQGRIFDPLGMTHTTVAQPVPAALAAHLATGYAQVNGSPQPQPFEVFQIVPAGSASASASDMARFMIAHLQSGAAGDGRILQPQTAQMMQQTQFRNAPELCGVAYGFYETRVNGRRLLTHAGDTSHFHSQLLLLPEENLGLYLVYNAANSVAARQELIQAFFDQFYPAAPPQTTAVAPPAPQFTGRYLSTRSPQTTLEKIRLLFDPIYQPLTIRLGPDGSLESQQAGQTRRWLPLARQLYLQSNGQDRIAFQPDAQGNQMLFLDSIPLRGYRQLPWYEALLVTPLWPVLTMLALLGVMVWSFFDRRALPAARWLAIAAGGLVLLFTLGLVAFALTGFTAYLYDRISPLWWALFALPLLLIPVSAALLGFALWPSSMGNGRRLLYTLSGLAAVGFIIWTHYWNLLGWHF